MAGGGSRDMGGGGGAGAGRGGAGAGCRRWGGGAKRADSGLARKVHDCIPVDSFWGSRLLIGLGASAGGDYQSSLNNGLSKKGLG